MWPKRSGPELNCDPFLPIQAAHGALPLFDTPAHYTPARRAAYRSLRRRVVFAQGHHPAHPPDLRWKGTGTWGMYQLIDTERGLLLLELPAAGAQRAAARMASVMALRHARSRTVLLLGAPQPRLYLRNAAGPLIPCKRCDDWFQQHKQEELCPACHSTSSAPSPLPRKRRRRAKTANGQLSLPLTGPDDQELRLPEAIARQLAERSEAL